MSVFNYGQGPDSHANQGLALTLVAHSAYLTSRTPIDVAFVRQKCRSTRKLLPPHQILKSSYGERNLITELCQGCD